MGKGKNDKEGGKGVKDDRFAAVHYDPRFQRFPKAKSKVEVDDRFKGMFNDPAFQVGSGMDKRGRKDQTKKKNEDMKRYYRLKDEDEWRKDAEEGNQGEEEHEEDKEEEEEAKLKASKVVGKKKTAIAEPELSSEDDADSEEESENDEDEDSEEAAARERWARMRGLTGPESSSSEEEEDEGEDLESDPSGSVSDPESEDLEVQKAEEAEWGVGALAANPREKIPLLPDATNRLACVDLDWEHITAVDIFVALRSFLPSNGTLQRVTVYPSDYGLERMAAEAKAGPQGIWQAPKGKAQQGKKHTVEVESDSEEAEEDSDDDLDESDEDEVVDDEAADGEVDHEKLRLYERSKLRWYYAIVECDSPETANQLYEECDGMELMKTANVFDLRFVPDGQSFTGRKVRDTATQVPSDYEPPVFQTKALQHTNVDLTWDKGDDSRKRTLNKKITADQLKEDDFRAYLATDSDGSDDEDGDDRGAGGDKEDAEAIRERYRRLLLSDSGGGDAAKERTGKKDWNGDGGEKEEGSSGEEAEEEADDEKMDMEVTFVPGLEGLGERLMAKRRDAQAKAGETVWDAYMRRKKEKKAEAKRKGKVNIDSDDEVSDFDDEADSESDGEGLPSGVADDPFFQHEEDPFNDPFFNNGPGDAENGTTAGVKGIKLEKKGKDKGKAKGKKGGDGGGDEEVDRRRRAELEMLLMDEDALLKAGKSSTGAGGAGGGSGASAKLSKKERMRLKKEKQRRERQAESDDEDHQDAAGAGFKVNMDDPRFKDLYGSADFALDPTDPRFAKAGPGAATMATEVAKRRSKAPVKSVAVSAKGGDGSDGKKQGGGGGSGGGSGKADLKMMVASLKRKAAVTEAGNNAGGGGSRASKQRKGSKF